MKSNHFLAIMAATLVLFACKTAKETQNPKQTPATTKVETSKPMPPKPAPFIQWDHKRLDLGKVKKGEIPTFAFEFTNVSTEDVQIDIVDHCDCTEVEYPRGVFKPGQKGRLDCAFKSAEKDSTEVVEINVILKNMDKDGNPRIEKVQYTYDLIK